MHIFLAFLVPYMILLQPVPVPAKNSYILNYYLIFKAATLKVKLPVGFPIKQMAQF